MLFSVRASEEEYQALLVACSDGDYHTANKYFKKDTVKERVDAKFSQGDYSLLEQTCKSSSENPSDVIDLLLTHPKTLDHIADNNNYILFLSIRFKNHPVARRLLQEETVASGVSADNNFLLNLACRQSDINSVTLLIEFASVKAELGYEEDTSKSEIMDALIQKFPKLADSPIAVTKPART